MMNSTNTISQLSRLRVEYQNGKVKHDKWVAENQSMLGTPEYDAYIDQFRAWEEEILNGIEKLQQMITRRPVEHTPQLPVQDLDGQLYAMLENIPKKKFTAAFVKLCKEDPSIFGILTEVCHTSFFEIEYLDRQPRDKRHRLSQLSASWCQHIWLANHTTRFPSTIHCNSLHAVQRSSNEYAVSATSAKLSEALCATNAIRPNPFGLDN
jgi:hypothetical protein